MGCACSGRDDTCVDDDIDRGTYHRHADAYRRSSRFSDVLSSSAGSRHSHSDAGGSSPSLPSGSLRSGNASRHSNNGLPPRAPQSSSSASGSSPRENAGAWPPLARAEPANEAPAPTALVNILNPGAAASSSSPSPGKRSGDDDHQRLEIPGAPDLASDDDSDAGAEERSPGHFDTGATRNDRSPLCTSGNAKTGLPPRARSGSISSRSPGSPGDFGWRGVPTASGSNCPSTSEGRRRSSSDEHSDDAAAVTLQDIGEISTPTATSSSSPKPSGMARTNSGRRMHSRAVNPTLRNSSQRAVASAAPYSL